MSDEFKFSTWEPQWPQTQHEVFRDFGFAAFTAQMLESSIVQILLAAEMTGKITLPKSNRGDDIETFLNQQTMGRLIHWLKERGCDQATADLLDEALKARNFLIHGFFSSQSDEFTSDVGRAKLLLQLQDLRFRIGRVQHMFSQIREQLFEKEFGITKAQLRERYRQFQKQQLESN